MNVLSLFDGISCGQVTLEKVGIKVNKYFSSEIDKYVIQITQKNHPETIQIGDVLKVKSEDLPRIDLLIGGSPCQSFSSLGDGSGFNGKSKLFFEFVRLLKDTKPKYFLFENVKMKKEYQDIISKYLGVEPIEINSSLVSAQIRKRLYWTNLPNITQPEDKKIYPKDIIIGEGFPTSAVLLKSPRRVLLRKSLKFGTLTTSYYKGVDGAGRPCVSLKEGELRKDRTSHRMLSPIECERLQNLPDNYTFGISNTQRYKALGNCWTIDVIAHIFKGLLEELNSENTAE